MRAFWDAKAKENALYFIHSELDYNAVDEEAFWASGRENLDKSLDLFGASIEPADRVLEIGCGIGRMTRAIAERAGSVTGIDVSSEMVDRARRALSDLANVEFILGNGRDLGGVADGTFDVVYSFIVFQHIPDPAITCNYVREVGRVLRPGGWTVFQVSQLPELHQRDQWKAYTKLSARARRLLGRAPRGMAERQWLGSAVSTEQLLEAVGAGGMVVDGIVGEGTQFCVVHAFRPPEPGPAERM
jgi:ubiquinone/menaquinone biosynthesis C-methylase UbiE